MVLALRLLLGVIQLCFDNINITNVLTEKKYCFLLLVIPLQLICQEIYVA